MKIKVKTNQMQSKISNKFKTTKDNQFFNTLSDKAKTLMVNIKELDDWLDKTQLICAMTDGKTKYNFSNFTFPLKFASKIYNKDFTLQEVEDDQQKLNILINKLNNDYNPVNRMKIKEKKMIL